MRRRTSGSVGRWQFAFLPSWLQCLALHADRLPPLLDKHGGVHHQHGAATAHQAVGLLNQDPLQPFVRPGRGGNEVVQLLHLAFGSTLLRSPGSNKPRT